MEESSVQQISLGGMDVAMTMHIDQAVQARVDLVPDGSNYMLLEGGRRLVIPVHSSGGYVADRALFFDERGDEIPDSDYSAEDF